MRVRIALVNEDQNVRYDDIVVELPDDIPRGEVFWRFRAIYGRCISMVYFDPGIECGWVFQRREVHDSDPKQSTFLRTAWVMIEAVVQEAVPEKVVPKPLAELG